MPPKIWQMNLQVTYNNLMVSTGSNHFVQQCLNKSISSTLHEYMIGKNVNLELRRPRPKIFSVTLYFFYISFS